MKVSSQVSITNSAELVQHFAVVFASVLDECRGYDIKTGPAGLPQALRDLVSDQYNRNLAWGALALVGIPRNLSEAQGQALMISLLPHLIQGDLIAQAAFLRVAQQAVATRDYELYRALGQGCSVAPIDPGFIALLTAPFCRLRCPNIQHDKALQMWSDVFVERSSNESLEAMVGEIRARLVKGEKSSYDHLLTTLCNARDRSGVDLLENLIDPSKVQKKLATESQFAQRKLTPRDFAHDAIALISIGVVAAVGDVAIMPGAGRVIGFVGGALWGLYAVSRQKIGQGSEATDQERERELDLPSYAYFAERLYDKLTALAKSNPRASALKEAMDNYPRYAHLKDAS